jgi:tetratricopeptide (TPR) repeat protein
MIVKEHEENLQQTLDSLEELGGSIIIGHAGGQLPATKNAAIVRKLSLKSDISVTRNEISNNSNTNWQMYIEPWEILLSGHEEIKNALVNPQSKSFYINIMQGEDTITKQIRIWNKKECQFVNPVCEKIIDDNAEYIDATVWSAKTDIKFDLIEKWKKTNPLALEPYYYQSLYCLMNKNYNEFITLADHYMFHEKKTSISKTMMMYYLGIVNCFVKSNQNSAIHNALLCIAEHPLMAEFWCLLGDAYAKVKEFTKAISFYENAIFLGKNRLQSDRWPVQISKYEEYPQEMIKKCKEIISNSKNFGLKKNPNH